MQGAADGTGSEGLMAAVEAVPEVAGDAAETEAVDIKAGMEATGPVQGEAAAEIPEGCEAGAGVPAGDVPGDGEAAELDYLLLN